MSRSFGKVATSNNMSMGDHGVSAKLNGAAIISVHALVRPAAFFTDYNLHQSDGVFAAMLATDGNAGIYLCCGRDGTNDRNVVNCISRSTNTDSTNECFGVTPLSTATWYSIGCVANIGTPALRIYLNGAQDNATVPTYGAATYTAGATGGSFADAIGAHYVTPASANYQFSGLIAEVAIWRDRDIGTAGFLELAARKSPLGVYGGDLVCYWPLVGQGANEIDYISGVTGTINGTVGQGDHPRLYRPCKPGVGFGTGAPAQSNAPRAMYYEMLRSA